MIRNAAALLLALAVLPVAPALACTAEDTLNVITDPCCQTFVAERFYDVAPGATHVRIVSLTSCETTASGTYMLYGHILETDRSARTIKFKHKVDISVVLADGNVVGPAPGKGTDEQIVTVQITVPTTVKIVAHNEGHQVERVRLVWTPLQ